MALTKEKTLYSTELLLNGSMQSLYKIKIFDNGVLISETNLREVVPAHEDARIKAVCGEVVANQLKEIKAKNDEITKLKEEKEVLRSEKLALIDEKEAISAEVEELVKLKKE